MHYYEATAAGRHEQPLGDAQLRTEVAVIGGGFAGLGTAASLIERGRRDLVVLETGGVGEGASGRNGGFVFGGFSLEPAALLRQLGPATARELYAGTRDAVARIRERIGRHRIACDAVEGGALWLDWFDTPRSRAAMAAKAELLRTQFGVRWEAVPKEQVREQLRSERYGGALREADALHFQPLAYARGLADAIEAAGGRVCERSAVTRIERWAGGGWCLHTAAGGMVRADQLVLAGGATLHGLVPAVERARLPIATYVMTTEPLQDAQQPIRCEAALYDNRFAFDYYRRLGPLDGGRILWGGRISIRQRDPAAIARLLRRDMLRVFPQLAGVRCSHAWGGLMGYARHQMPQVGRLAPGLWYAQAFGGHGVAPTTLAGEWLAAALCGEALPPALARYGLSPVFGAAGLLAAQAHYSAAELRDALHAWVAGRP